MIYTISDIHSCYDKYKKLLKKLDLSPDDTLYVLGMSLTEARMDSKSCWTWPSGLMWSV